jgi:hypothetical protein
MTQFITSSHCGTVFTNCYCLPILNSGRSPSSSSDRTPLTLSKKHNRTRRSQFIGRMNFWPQLPRVHNSEKSVKDTTHDCRRSVLCPQYNTSWRLECAVSEGSHKTKQHKIQQQNRRTCKRTNPTVITTTQPKKTKMDSASQPKRRLMRTYFWISLVTSYRITAN